MKKYIVYAGMFVASFLVINVGMYFFLSFMQPEHVDNGLLGDSLLAESDTSVHPEFAGDSVLAAEMAEASDLYAVDSASTSQQETSLVANVETVPVAPVQSVASSQAAEVPEPQATALSEQSDIGRDEIPEEGAQYDPLTDDEEMLPAEEEYPQPDPKELTKLAKLLEGMKPDEAAAIAARLEVEEIVALVMKMKERKAAKILAALPIDKAARVAERMSEIVAYGGVRS